MESINWEFVSVVIAAIMAISGVFWVVIRGTYETEDKLRGLEAMIQKGIHDNALRDQDMRHTLDKHVSLPGELAHSVVQTSEV